MGGGGCGGVFERCMHFSITDRKRVTQLMSHTFKCPPKYTEVFYSVRSEVKKADKACFYFGVILLGCSLTFEFLRIFNGFPLKDGDNYKHINPSAQVIIYGYLSLQFLSAKELLIRKKKSPAVSRVMF